MEVAQEPQRSGGRAGHRLSRLLKQFTATSCAAAEESSSALRVEPVPDCTCGAVVRNVSLETLTDADWATIHEAFLKYGVLVFPGQHELTPKGQVAFASRFGKPEQHELTTGPGGTQPISNLKRNGKVRTPEESPTMLLNQAWHIDTTFMPRSGKCNMLFAEELPPSGRGETEFCDLRAAYEALDEPTRAKIAPMAAYHSVMYSCFRRTGKLQNQGFRSEYFHPNAYLRPLVKTHPETGRKALFFASHAFGVPGLSPEASEELLDGLAEFACQAPRCYKHTWTKGDLVVWDNRCMAHRARPYVFEEPRALRGMRVEGEMSEVALPAGFAEAALKVNLDRVRETQQWLDGDARLR